MVEPITDISPRTRALAVLAEASVEELRHGGVKAGERLLFSGSWQEPIPHELILSPDLDATAKLTWEIMRIYADRNTATAAPSYKQYQEAGLKARATVAAALTALRVARWVTKSEQVRARGGQWRGVLYMLHDSPLAIPDTLFLDECYPGFVVETLRNHRALSVQQLAEKALEELARHGVHILNGGGVDRVQILNPGQTGENPQNQADNDGVQNLNSIQTSSCFREETTTLEWPRELTGEQRAAAQEHLDTLPSTQRQDVLDELAGRMSIARQANRPIANPARYLASLCDATRAGKFVLEAGKGIRDQRRRRHEQGRHTPAEPPQATPEQLAANPLVRRLERIRDKQPKEANGG